MFRIKCHQLLNFTNTSKNGDTTVLLQQLLNVAADRSNISCLLTTYPGVQLGGDNNQLKRSQLTQYYRTRWRSLEYLCSVDFRKLTFLLKGDVSRKNV